MASDIMKVYGEEVRIESNEVVQSLRKLEKNFFFVIEKGNNTISYQLWRNLDCGRGIAYTTDGAEPITQFLTKSKKLKENNWYYYEEDYNEWRLKNG